MIEKYHYFVGCFLVNCTMIFSGAFISRQKRQSKTSLNQELLAFSRRSFRGDLDQINFFINRGADCNVQDEKGRSPLHYAAVACNVPMAALLLKHGANLKLEDKFGDTPRDIIFRSCFERQKRLFVKELDEWS